MISAEAQPVETELQRAARRQTLVLTHYGRISGKPYQVTIWFLTRAGRIYLSTANVERQWVRNVRKTPQVKLAIGNLKLEGEARFISDPAEREHVLGLVFRKYWMLWPVIAIWRLLQRAGMARDSMGAFEVVLVRP